MGYVGLCLGVVLWFVGEVVGHRSLLKINDSCVPDLEWKETQLIVRLAIPNLSHFNSENILIVFKTIIL